MSENSFSIQDVQRLQDQLIDKTQQNYELQEKCRRLALELAEERSRNDREVNQRSFAYSSTKGGFQNFLKGKNSKSVDMLEEEICRKLAEQEAEFKLQTETLLIECQRLAKMNEELETEKKNAKATDIMLPIADRGTSLLPNEPARTDDISFEIMKQEISDLTLKLVMKTDELKEMQSGYELLKVENSTLESKLHHANIQVSECQDKLEISQLQLQESNSAKACLSSQLEMAKNGVIKMQQQLLQTESVAEERKTLMETMAEHMEQVRHENEESISAVKHEADQRDLEWKRKLEIFERNQIEMNSLRDGLENLKSKLESATATNERLSKDLMNSQIDLQSATMDYEKQLKNTLADAHFRIATASEAHLQEMKALQDETVQLQDCVELLTSEKAAAHARVDDLQNQMKQMEKKHKAAMKDLKKQLIIETKRADRLQEKMLESAVVEADFSFNRDIAEPNKADVQPEKCQLTVSRGDAHSVSSWSLVSKDNSRDSAERRSASQPIQDSTDAQSGTSEQTTLELENEDLIRKLAELQKDKWELEEKIQILESSSMNTGIGRITPMHIGGSSERQQCLTPGKESQENWTPMLRKFVDLLKANQTTTDMLEMNKRLQLLLEETLTKNISLSRDMELLSLEVQRLSEELERRSVDKLPPQA